MPAPAYHLRTNKAVDRYLFIEALRYLIPANEIAKYTYFGFGGPYLDDFRILHELFPDLNMVSLERDEETYKRQYFHRPCKKVNIIHDELGSFLNSYMPSTPSIFWLDYTRLELPELDWFQSTLGKVLPGSIVKISLQAEPKFHRDDAEFQKKFSGILPAGTTSAPTRLSSFCKLLQQMVQICAQKALPSASGFTFQPISSFYYKDGRGMFTLTGIVCEQKEAPRIRKEARKWKLANVDWRINPREIDVPTLSTKERLKLQKFLPCKTRNLVKSLGYEIDGKNSVDQMQQYAEFYRQYPYFIRGVP